MTRILIRFVVLLAVGTPVSPVVAITSSSNSDLQKELVGTYRSAVTKKGRVVEIEYFIDATGTLLGKGSSWKNETSGDGSPRYQFTQNQIRIVDRSSANDLWSKTHLEIASCSRQKICFEVNETYKQGGSVIWEGRGYFQYDRKSQQLDCYMTDKFGKQGVRCTEYQKIITTTAVAETESTETKIDKSIELEFWQNVKDSDNEDLLRAYLEHYPNGKFKSLAEIKIKQLTSSIGNNTANGSNESANKTTGSTTGMSGVEKECFEDFHRYGGSEWRRAVQGQAADGPVDDIDLHKCEPFVSKDMKTWIGSNPDTGGAISSESVSNNNEAQDSVWNQIQPSSSASTVAISRRQWCVTESGVHKVQYADCLKKNGIPTRGQAGAIVDRASSYFREGKKNKAFAISTDNIGDSGSWKSGGDAIKRSLLNCYIYSSVPSSCRVVNVNGRYEEHFDEQRARDSAFGAKGPVSDLVGTYYFEMNYQGIDGTLRVKMSGASISAKFETCIEGLCTDWTLKPNPYTRGGRRLTGTMKRGPKGQTWTAREIFFRASFSKDTKRIIGNFGFYEFEGKKRSAN